MCETEREKGVGGRTARGRRITSRGRSRHLFNKMFNVFWQVSYVRCWESGCARQHSSGLTSAAVPGVGKKAGGFTMRRGKKLEIHIWDSFSYISVNTPQFHSIFAQVHGNTSGRASNAALCASAHHLSSLHFYLRGVACYKVISGLWAQGRNP